MYTNIKFTNEYEPQIKHKVIKLLFGNRHFFAHEDDNFVTESTLCFVLALGFLLICVCAVGQSHPLNYTNMRAISRRNYLIKHELFAPQINKMYPFASDHL